MSSSYDGAPIELCDYEKTSWRIKSNSKDQASNKPANIYLFQVNNRNTRKRCEICSELIIKTQNDVTGVFIVNF